MYDFLNFPLVVPIIIICFNYLSIFGNCETEPPNNNNNNIILNAEIYKLNNQTDPQIAISIKNSNSSTRFFHADRYGRFLNNYQNAIYNPNEPSKSVENNEIIVDKEDKMEYEDPTAPLHGIYSDCLLQLSFPCVQRKFLVFLDRLGRLKAFNILGDFLSIIRVRRELGPVLKEADLEARLNPIDAQTVLSALTELTIERFFKNHILRVTLPTGVTASLPDNSRSFGNTIDINITKTLEEATGRGKGDKKMKKFMSMMMSGLMGKMAIMGPMMLLLLKLKALKALLLSKLALILSLFQLLKGGGKKGGGGGGSGKEVIIVHDSHGGGGGHDAYSSGWATGGGGGGGWLAPATHGDSYSAGVHTGGGDNTYAGAADTYSAGGQGGWAAGAPAAPAGHGWGRKSSNGNDPHYVAYRAYIPPDPED